MKSTTNVNLNLQLPNYSTVVYAVQDDVMSREIQATLLDGSSPWVVPYGTLGTVRYLKPDGTVGFYDTLEDGETEAVTYTGNVATIRFAEQMLAVAGDVIVQVTFYSADAERLTCFNFTLVVEKNLVSDAVIESTDYYSVLTQQIASILEVVTNMPAPATTLPLMDGTAAIGVRGEFARSDHVHPVDTTSVLQLKGVTVSKTTGNIVSVNNASITGDHVLIEIRWANPSAITTDVTWSTSSSSLTLNGTCAKATTADIVLIKKYS